MPVNVDSVTLETTEVEKGLEALDNHARETEKALTEVKKKGEEYEKQLKQLDNHAEITAKTVITTTRKGFESIALMADIFGIAIPMWFSLMAEAAFMAGAMFAEMAAAETATGWLAAKAGLTFSIATMMFFRALQLQAQRTEVEQKLNSIIQLANIWG